MSDPAETVWEGRYLAVRKRGRWEYAERQGHISAVVIFAVDGEGRLILVEQHRVPLGRRSLELPAGLVGDDGAAEDIAAAARRELEEETGYRAGLIEAKGAFFSSPGMTSECFTLVIASQLERVGEGGGEAGEDITVHRVPLREAAGFVAEKRAEGLAIDAKMLLVLAADLLAAV